MMVVGRGGNPKKERTNYKSGGDLRGKRLRGMEEMGGWLVDHGGNDITLREIFLDEQEMRLRGIMRSREAKVEIERERRVWDGFQGGRGSTYL